MIMMEYLSILKEKMPMTDSCTFFQSLSSLADFLMAVQQLVGCMLSFCSSLFCHQLLAAFTPPSTRLHSAFTTSFMLPAHRQQAPSRHLYIAFPLPSCRLHTPSLHLHAIPSRGRPGIRCPPPRRKGFMNHKPRSI